jgi:hypothetical protein
MLARKFEHLCFIYVTGCDGAGKTTQANLLQQRLEAEGVPVRRLWLRFPFFFSLPLLAYARWRGLSWHEQDGGASHGYWDFRRSRLLRLLLPWTLLIDASLAGLFKIYLPLWRGETVVCERYILDMLVDLGVAFDEADLARRLPGALYLRLLPRDAQMFILDSDAAALRQRRPDLSADRNLEAKLAAFRQLARVASLPLLPASQPAGELNESIWQRLTIPTRE